MKRVTEGWSLERQMVPSLEDALVAELVCSNCQAGLWEGPIHQCIEGHLACPSCKPTDCRTCQNPLHGRNKALERLRNIPIRIGWHCGEQNYWQNAMPVLKERTRDSFIWAQFKTLLSVSSPSPLFLIGYGCANINTFGRICSTYSEWDQIQAICNRTQYMTTVDGTHLWNTVM